MSNSCHLSRDINIHQLGNSQQLLTDNQSEVFQLPGTPLVLYRGQSPFEEILRPECSFLVHDDL